MHDYALWFFLFDDGKNVFKRERFEIEAIGSVVIGRNRFRVAIHHDGFVAVFMQRKASVAATIIELDSLPDAIGPAAENHDFVAGLRVGFVFVLIG